MFVILFNGPPRAGKDTAVAAYEARGRRFNIEKRKFAESVKTGTHAIFGLFNERGQPYPAATFESVKNEPRDEFWGMSPRQAYIWYSEEVMKPKFGSGIFGRIEAKNLVPGRIHLFSDSGFATEAEEVAKVAGRKNMFLVRLYREGCTFDKDSRSYISVPGVDSVDLTNDGTDEFHDVVAGVVDTWLNTRIDDNGRAT